MTQKRVRSYKLEPLPGNLLDMVAAPPFDNVPGMQRMDDAMIQESWASVRGKRKRAMEQGGELPQQAR